MIFDTAGRQEVDEALIDELRHLHSFLSPRETLLVVDAATGQQAVGVAQTFDRAVNVTGIVLTKLDGDARGGAALSMRSVTGKPIKFSGEGEKLDQFGPSSPAAWRTVFWAWGTSWAWWSMPPPALTRNRRPNP